MDHNPSSLQHLEMDGQGFFDEDEFLSDDIFHQAESSLCPQVESDHNSSSSYAADAVADAVNNTSFTHNNDGFPASTGANSFFNDPKHPAVSAFTLSFDKSTIIPITDEPPCLARTSSPPSKRQRAIRSAEHRNKSRSSSEVIHHIMTERRRRQDLTQKFIALAATIPGLKKMDKATVLCEAIDYVKRLQERVRELENSEKKRKRRGGGGGGGRVRKEKTSTEKCWCCRAQEAVEVPEMEVRVLENEVLVRVQCEGRRDMMRKTVELLEHVHLPVSCCNSLAFGNSALSITMVAQMKDQYKMKVNDLIKYLRQHLFKSQDVR